MAVKNIKEVIESLSMFRNLYDVVRVVDPVRKQVINLGEMGEETFGTSCYNFWGTGKQCENCISRRAITQNDSFIKIECQGEETFMVMASPINIEGQEYIVEMVKNVTENDIMAGLDQIYLNQTSLVIADLNKKIVTDALTGVYNRHYINERLPVELFAAIDNDWKLSVLMIDIDLFKNVNDTYGHPAGDAALKQLCQVIQENIRKDSDWVARYGGEEFIVFLKHADQEAAYRVAENLRKRVEKEVIKHDGHTFYFTISIGAYTLESGAEDFNEVIAEADKNLYKAKKQGRNQTISS